MPRKLKVGILTYHFYEKFANYGSVLQAYAMQRYLSKLGVENEIIDYVPDHLRSVNMRLPILRDKTHNILRFINLLFFQIQIYRLIGKFESFVKKNMRLSKEKIYSDNFDKAQYGAYIIGSDTVWSTDESGGFDDGFWANYPVMRGKLCIAYSPSAADMDFSESDKQTIKERLKNFSAVSMRESRHISLFSSLANREISNTLDPTLLLDKPDYEALIDGKRIFKEKYLLYYARKRHVKMYKFIDELAKKLNLRVVEINKDCLRLFKVKNVYCSSIEDFLRLIRDASVVVTDSFHGTIFSMIFERDFYSYKRQCCSSKIEHLCACAGLSNRIVCDGADADKAIAEGLKIDYAKVRKNLEPRREFSKSYLKKALGLV